MFGFSFSELLIVALVIFLFVKPKDLPEIAQFCGRLFFKAKKLFFDAKNYLMSLASDLGLDDLKQEMEKGMADEKVRQEDKSEDEDGKYTTIIDLEGNEHKVRMSDIDDFAQKAGEIKNLNDQNLKIKENLNIKELSKKDSEKDAD
jgi:Sec-independent protein translocase protein TatA